MAGARDRLGRRRPRAATLAAAAGVCSLVLVALPVWVAGAAPAIPASFTPDHGVADDIVAVTISGCRNLPGEPDLVIEIDTEEGTEGFLDQRGYGIDPDGGYEFFVPPEFDYLDGDTSAGPGYPLNVYCVLEGQFEITAAEIGTFTYDRDEPSTTSTSAATSSTSSTTSSTSSTTTVPVTTSSSTTSTTSPPGSTTTSSPTTSTTAQPATTTTSPATSTSTSTTATTAPPATTTSTTTSTTTTAPPATTTTSPTTSTTAAPGTTTTTAPAGTTTSTAPGATTSTTATGGSTSTTSTTAPAGGSSTSTTSASSTSSTTSGGSTGATVDDTTPNIGQGVNVSANGFAPNSSVTVDLLSTPVRLATFVANGAGVASGTVTIPLGTTAGPHELRFTGTAANGSQLVRSIAITVSRDLPRTGTDSWTVLRVSLLLVGFGLLALGRAQLLLARAR